MTPPKVIEAARACMGGIDLDVCSTAEANEVVQADHYYTKEDDGLKQVWYGRVWMNHPFGRIENTQWPLRLVHEYWQGNVDMALMICFGSFSERWFRHLTLFPMCLIQGRINYRLPRADIVPGVKKRAPPRGSIVSAIGIKPEVFHTHFHKLGAIMVPYHDPEEL